MPADLSLDSKIQLLVAEGRTAREIASILGRNQVVVSRDCQRLGITPARTSNLPPYGLTDGSLKLRMVLADILTEMIWTHMLTTPEVSEITGLNQREIGRASHRPYHHDWTLSQIERTLGFKAFTIKDTA